MATISFDLVSPEQLLFNDEAGMIIVPGKDGDIGVLPRHSKVLSSLRSGRVMVYGENKNLLKSFFVAEGFVEINPEKCIDLAEGVNEMIDLDNTLLVLTSDHGEYILDNNMKPDFVPILQQNSRIEKNKISNSFLGSFGDITIPSYLDEWGRPRTIIYKRPPIIFIITTESKGNFICFFNSPFYFSYK